MTDQELLSEIRLRCINPEFKEHVKDILKARTVKKFVPPTEQDVIVYFKSEGYSDESAKKAFKYYSMSDWKDGNGKQVKNWKQKMFAVWFKDENKVKVLGHPYSDEQVRMIKRRLERDGDGSYPEWFDMKYKPILNFFTLVGQSTRRNEE